MLSLLQWVFSMDLTLLYTFSTSRIFFFFFIGLILPCVKYGKLQGKGEVIRGGVGDVLEDCVGVALSECPVKEKLKWAKA